jgi:hypothetical protein
MMIDGMFNYYSSLEKNQQNAMTYSTIGDVTRLTLYIVSIGK